MLSDSDNRAPKPNSSYQLYRCCSDVSNSPENDLLISASTVPHSAHSGSVPNLAAIPESPTRHRPSAWVARPNSVAVPNHESLSPYSLHTPLDTRSYQDIPFHTRFAREASTEDNLSTNSHRLSVATTSGGSTHAVTGSAARVSSRAPSRYFGGGLAQASRSPSRSRAPSPVRPNGPSIATPLSTPRVRPESLASSSVGLSIQSPSEPSLGPNESLASLSLQRMAIPHSRQSSRVELGAAVADPSSPSVTVDDWSQPTMSLPIPPSGRVLYPLAPEITQRYDRNYVM